MAKVFDGNKFPFRRPNLTRQTTLDNTHHFDMVNRIPPFHMHYTADLDSCKEIEDIGNHPWNCLVHEDLKPSMGYGVKVESGMMEG